MSDEQESIQTALADRAEKKREELGLGKPLAQGLGMEVIAGIETVCACGQTYLQNRIGEGSKSLISPTECQACREKRTGRKVELETAEQKARHAAQRELSLKARTTLLQVPPFWEDATLATFEHHGDQADKAAQMRVLTFARRYLDQFPDVQAFTVFQGGFGTGKGHICWAIAKALVSVGSTARVIKLPGMVRRLRDTWRRDSDTTYEEVLAEFTSPDLLVIDEASRHAFYGQQIHQHLYDVVDTRIELCRPTIITTNEDEAGLEEVLRPALFNRLQGEGGIVPFGSASWRSRVR